MIDLNKLELRKANIDDLKDIVTLIHDDILGKDRERPELLNQYNSIFEKILKSDNQQYFVVQYSNEIIGCFELTILYALSITSSIRLEVENVRVHSKYRSCGIGKWMFSEITKFAQENNCSIIQLTSNKIRKDAHKFYTSIGYKNSHEGFKLYL
ncbi:MAG: GNAT family N-acetyltransferase [Neisseriaceae bacterium]|jgi:N-acetylglutamate synthase-like GNAT family acetyltransferase